MHADAIYPRGMAMHSKVQKLSVLVIAVTFVSAMIASALPTQAFADSPRPMQAKSASSSTKANSGAHAEYEKIISSLAKDSDGKYRDTVRYYYADVYGDTVDEALIAVKSKEGSGWQLFIYTYEGGAARSILDMGFYGDDGYSFYKSTKSFYASYSGHGGMHNDFYAYKGKAYHLVARAMKPDSSKGGDDAWSYSDGKNTISSSSFDDLTQGLKKGDAVRVPSSAQWESVPVK